MIVDKNISIVTKKIRQSECERKIVKSESSAVEEGVDCHIQTFLINSQPSPENSLCSNTPSPFLSIFSNAS